MILVPTTKSIRSLPSSRLTKRTEATLGFLSIPSFSIRYASVKVKMPSVTKSTPSMVEAIGIAVSKLVLSISHFRHSSRSIMLAVVPPQIATLPS